MKLTNRSLRPFLFILTLLIAEGTRAQVSGPVRCKIYVPAIRGILTESSKWPKMPSSVRVTTNEGTQTLRLSRNGYSEIFTLPPNSELVVSRADKNSGGNSVPWIRLTLKPEVREALILVEPGTENGEGLVNADVLDISSERFVDGNIAFHNLLKNPVSLRIGEREVELPPKEHRVLQIDDRRLRIFLEETGVPRGRRYTGAVHIRPDRPTLVTIRPNPASALRLEVQTFSGIEETD